jgi:hypothetical protein
VVDLTVEEKAFLTGLIAKHNQETAGVHDDHRLLMRKLKLTLAEWDDPNRRVLT